MARGDLIPFAAYEQSIRTGGYPADLDTNTLRVGIVTSAIVPTVATNDPRWGAGGATDFSANQVALSASGYNGPITLTGVTNTRASNVITLDANDVTVPKDDTAGFTNAAYAIVYDDTAAGKPCIFAVDLGGPVGNTTGAISLAWDILGISTTTVTAGV